MNDDYLWDKTGKPDPEIQELENILGTLRYQPRELKIPQVAQPRRRSFILRGLAIAAAVALIALGVGVWTRMQQQSPKEVVAVQLPPEVAPPVRTPEKTADARTSDNVLTTASNGGAPDPMNTPRRHSTALNKRRLPTRTSQLSESELAEAKAAKEQLMLALRVASSKLNLAQKRAQGTTDEIHNQHKTG